MDKSFCGAIGSNYQASHNRFDLQTGPSPVAAIFSGNPLPTSEVWGWGRFVQREPARRV